MSDVGDKTETMKGRKKAEIVKHRERCRAPERQEDMVETLDELGCWVGEWAGS